MRLECRLLWAKQSASIYATLLTLLLSSNRVGLVVKGLDTAVINMHVGDRYKLTFGGDYAFPGGRGSSAGKPRIPPGADIDYEVQIIELPGKGEDMIADVDDDIVE